MLLTNVALNYDDRHGLISEVERKAVDALPIEIRAPPTAKPFTVDVYRERRWPQMLVFEPRMELVVRYEQLERVDATVYSMRLAPTGVLVIEDLNPIQVADCHGTGSADRARREYRFFIGPRNAP